MRDVCTDWFLASRKTITALMDTSTRFFLKLDLLVVVLQSDGISNFAGHRSVGDGTVSERQMKKVSVPPVISFGCCNAAG